MKLVANGHKGVYIQFRDRSRRKKSESLTVADLTPKQAMREFARWLRTQQRKAG